MPLQPSNITQRNAQRRKRLRDGRFFGPNPVTQAFTKQMDESGVTMEDIQTKLDKLNEDPKRKRKVI